MLKMSAVLMQAVGRIWSLNMERHGSSDVLGTLGRLPSRQVCAPVLMGVGGTNAASTELVAMTWSQPVSLKARVGEGRLGQIAHPQNTP